MQYAYYLTRVLKEVTLVAAKYLVLGAFEKLLKASVSFVMSVHLSVRPYGITRLPLDGFSRNLIYDFSKIYLENSSFIKSDNNNGYLTLTGTLH